MLPQGADILLAAYEAKYGIPRPPDDASVASRRANILAAASRTAAGASGLAWVDKLTAALGSGMTYIEGTGAGPPAANTIEIALPYGTSLPAPATLAVGTKTAGGLPNATYYWTVTAVNAYGETTISNRVTTTVSAGNGTVPLTWVAVDGAASYNVYRGTVSGSEKLVGSSAVASWTDTGPAMGTQSAPTVNTTQPPSTAIAQSIARAITPAHIALTYTYSAGFLVGISRVGDETI